MAIDTKSKRASVFGVGRPWMREHNPDATLNALWRATSGNTYGGNPFGAPVIPLVGGVGPSNRPGSGLVAGGFGKGSVNSGKGAGKIGSFVGSGKAG